jgi:SAM-dependent methyltransferase
MVRISPSEARERGAVGICDERAERIRQYYEVAIREGLWSRADRLRVYNEFLFSGIRFEERSVLDIGGGTGLFSFYAAACGARSVVCLEPDTAGSTTGQTSRFEHISKVLNLSSVRLIQQTLQEFDADPGSFDVILMHNSVNHLDEQACVRLRQDRAAASLYSDLFRKVAKLASEGADLIVTDCSSQNFFPLLGLQNPVARTIDWRKHQPPEVWRRILCNSGFGEPRVRWSSLNCLGRLGWWILGNKPAAFFLASQFRLQMRKQRLLSERA